MMLFDCCGEYIVTLTKEDKEEKRKEKRKSRTIKPKRLVRELFGCCFIFLVVVLSVSFYLWLSSTADDPTWAIAVLGGRVPSSQEGRRRNITGSVEMLGPRRSSCQVPPLPTPV